MKLSIIKPIGDRVLIEPISDENAKTKTGIYLPETAEKERPMKGKVIAVGEGRRLDNGSVRSVSVKNGDTVLFTKYGPTELKVDEKEYLIAREEDILAILE